MFLTLVLLISAYLIGAIPTGYLIARWAGIYDITKHGSGNIGATNVARLLGTFYFIPVFLIDCLKAFIFLQFAYLLGYKPLYLPLSCTLLFGNSCSIFLQGRGGKGVATSLGILLAWNPVISGLLVLLWLVALIITKTIGIASVITALSALIVVIASRSYDLMLLILVMVPWILWTHRTNIARYVRSVYEV